MTEAEWLKCTDPWKMVAMLRGRRKRRLFAVGCCRRLIPLFPVVRACVETAERFADGHIGRRRLRVVWHECFPQEVRSDYYSPIWYVRGAVYHLMMDYCLTARPKPTAMDDAVAAVVESRCKWWDLWGRRKVRSAERTSQCHLIRDLVGNPFHAIAVAPAWLTWNGCTVPSLARAMYDDRRFQELPILADALEESGCDNTDILNHCRQPGEHVRGCWLLDLILSKDR